MCGIVGYYNQEAKREDISSIIDLMNSIQVHRGPNSDGKFINNENNLGFKMCRLSILDLELGIQPMHSRDKRYTIIFNGTILNSPELRKELTQEGIKFYTNNSDTEVLLNLIIKYGTKKLSVLNGSFAFALYDSKEKKLLCARDRFGSAPFYYLHDKNKFLFASELKSILYSGHSKKKINQKSLSHYLSLYCVPGPETIIQDIQKLSPGHFLEFDLNNKLLKITDWHNPNFIEDNSIKQNEWPEKILSALTNSVKRATLSDVPVSCGLSGGLDSQLVVGLLSKMNIKSNTFTLSFSDESEGALNELISAKRAANYFKTNHEEIILDKKNYLDDLDKMIYHLDEPYGGGLPLWHVFKKAGKDFGVMLTGLGGDEHFGNFGRWVTLEKTGYNLFPTKIHFKKLFFDRNFFFSDEMKNKLLKDFNHKDESTNDYLFRILNQKKGKPENIRNKMYSLDFKTKLPDEYNNMINKFSMANGIEARAPFLDNEISDMMMTVPSRFRTIKSDFKYLLRQTVKDILPAENLHARKRGFVGPETEKAIYEFDFLINEIFEESKIKRQKIFDYEFLKNFILTIKNNSVFLEKKLFGIYDKRYSHKSLWALIMFQKWYDLLIDETR